MGPNASRSGQVNLLHQNQRHLTPIRLTREHQQLRDLQLRNNLQHNLLHNVRGYVDTSEWVASRYSQLIEEISEKLDK